MKLNELIKSHDRNWFFVVLASNQTSLIYFGVNPNCLLHTIKNRDVLEYIEYDDRLIQVNIDIVM